MLYHTEAFDRYLDDHRSRFLDEFARFIAQPSVAADLRGVSDMAQLVAERMRQLGATVTLHPTPGSPIVYAELGPENAARTLMIYNHYDVQPEDPLDLWETRPFELVLKDGMAYGRGTADDKGELLARIQAVEGWLKTQGELPVRLKWVVEGEEEIGSVHLEEWVKQHADMLQADGVLWEGAGRDEAGRPTFGLGGKGLAYFELRCQGPTHDLHSSFAPLVINPAWRLVWALSTLKDVNDNITLDGYMEHVIPPTEEQWAMIDSIPLELEAKRQLWGPQSWPEGLSDHEGRRRYFSAPTITICGIHSGYGGEGSKTVLPAEAVAKLDFRLVNGLTSELAERLLREHLDRRGFTDITLTALGGEEFAASPPNSLAEHAAVAASRDIWNMEPLVYPWFAGSGPMYPFATLLGIPLILAGATWHPDSRMHSPNENIYVKDYFEAMRFTAAFIARFATLEA